MSTMRRLTCGLVLAVVAVVATPLPLPVATAQTTTDPQSLVGEWVGTWNDRNLSRTNGKYYLTIEKVEGNKVFGKGETTTNRNNQFRFQGTFDGSRLTFGRDIITELMVDGDRMEGTSTGRANWRILLNKQK